MSSIPGYTLEDYVAWQHDVVVEGEDDPNTSVRLAELVGNVPLRPRLTQEQFAKILVPWEPSRERIERYLLDYEEEDHGSWRDYNSFAMDFPETEIAWEEGNRIKKELLAM